VFLAISPIEIVPAANAATVAFTPSKRTETFGRDSSSRMLAFAETAVVPNAYGISGIWTWLGIQARCSDNKRGSMSELVFARQNERQGDHRRTTSERFSGNQRN
jgi:hypothetical protein